LNPGQIDWEKIFADEGTRWFHTGAILAALSDTTPLLAHEAMECARRNGTIISYDLNYRPSLWKANGGQTRAIEVNRQLAPLIDVMIGNEEDFTAALGFSVENADEHLTNLNSTNFRRMMKQVVEKYPNLKVVATTLRTARTATRNDWGAICCCGGSFYEARTMLDLEIYDRVGGGDSFASGLIYGLLSGRGPQLVRRLWMRSWRAGHDHSGRHHHVEIA
jgi:2-dehydro-3-deoxygluconokinase